MSGQAYELTVPARRLDLRRPGGAVPRRARAHLWPPLAKDPVHLVNARLTVTPAARRAAAALRGRAAAARGSTGRCRSRRPAPRTIAGDRPGRSRRHAPRAGPSSSRNTTAPASSARARPPASTRPATSTSRWRPHEPDHDQSHDRPDHAGGDPQRAGLDRRRDGADRHAQRLFAGGARHHGLLDRALRRAGARDRAGADAADPALLLPARHALRAGALRRHARSRATC